MKRRFMTSIYLAPDGGAGTGGESFDPSSRLDETPQRTSAKYETQLSKEYQADDFADIETIDKLYKGYKDLKAASANALKIPTAESSADEIKAFFTRIGMPEDKTGYELSDYDYNADEIKDAKDRFSDMAIRCGLTKGQAAKLWKHELAEYANIKGAMQAALEKKKTDYGKDYDSLLKTAYPDDAKRAERITLEDNLVKDFLAKTGLGDAFTASGLSLNPDAMHRIAAYHEQTSKGTAFGSSGGGSDPKTMTAEEALASIYGKKK